MIANGIDWIATDEDILFNSILVSGRKSRVPDATDRRIIYQPYKFKRDTRHITAVFRDKNLSDLISFNYNSWDQSAAAWDLIGHFRRVSENLRRDTDNGLLTIAMDGENAWEYFEDNGRVFFQTLYANLDREKNVGSTTISDFLDLNPPKASLSDIFPGSWINHNFNIWIGEDQDNAAWSYLDRTRRDLVKFTGQLQKKSGKVSAEDINKAWRSLYVAEGSDWNWWYHGKAHTSSDNPFDKLYRTHLANAYRFLKKPIPERLKISIA
jgi:alpha-amylase/alpha-mannosidase (GH57 family)